MGKSTLSQIYQQDRTLVDFLWGNISVSLLGDNEMKVNEMNYYCPHHWFSPLNMPRLWYAHPSYGILCLQQPTRYPYKIQLWKDQISTQPKSLVQAHMLLPNLRNPQLPSQQSNK